MSLRELIIRTALYALVCAFALASVRWFYGHGFILAHGDPFALSLLALGFWQGVRVGEEATR